jgi:hypothetical protein
VHVLLQSNGYVGPGIYTIEIQSWLDVVSMIRVLISWEVSSEMKKLPSRPGQWDLKNAAV